MDARLITLGGASLAGLVVGAAFWALSSGQAQGESLEAVTTRLAAISTRARAHTDRPSDALAQALATPLFAAGAQGSEAPADVSVQVFGLARSPVRTAALLGVGGAPPEWLAVGETRNGVTLRAVSGSGAVIATLFGEREITLGMPAQGQSANPAALASGPPPGFKSPPPPASAPGMSP